MAATEVRCLHSQMDDVVATAESGDIGEVRGKLTDMLRCSSHQGCSQAVTCSDDAMAVLRRVLGAPERSGSAETEIKRSD